MDKSIKILLLGCSGSIGTQTLSVIENNPDLFEVVGLSAHKNYKNLVQSSLKFKCNELCLSDDSIVCDNTKIKYRGEEGLVQLVCNSEADIVVNALVGAAGVMCSYHALKRGKKLALANKESLVIAGDLLNSLKKYDTQIMPIDSEHCAIFQCLVGENIHSVKNLWITCSGGPFYKMQKEQLKYVTATCALKHPTWKMGEKITIDSATLINKGLEVIEAHHLFNIDYDNIEVVIHPQSIIHSLVEFCDGSFKAQLGRSDMRIPIMYALSYPNRLNGISESLDLRDLQNLTFDYPDYQAFKCLDIAISAGREGGNIPCAMNGANEVANLLFRKNKCSFPEIPACIEYVLDNIKKIEYPVIEQLLSTDKEARNIAFNYFEK